MLDERGGKNKRNKEKKNRKIKRETRNAPVERLDVFRVELEGLGLVDRESCAERFNLHG